MTANTDSQTSPNAVNPITEDLLARFGLTDIQKAAARERARDVAVTAGAGSGKTRTLVARYLPLLAECGSPRRIVAITFTEKAAREMRNRIRGEVRKLITEAEDELTRQRWTDLESRLDSARISTIHSLCQELLRAHPVEAGLDPQFEVADENQAALLRADAVRVALTGAVEDLTFQPLFQLWKARTLESALNQLVNQRLELDGLLQADCDPNQTVRQALEQWVRSHLFQSALADLRQSKADGSLGQAANAADKFAAMALELLSSLEQAQANLASGKVFEASQALFTARRQKMKGNIGKAGSLKALIKDLREGYDGQLAWLGGAGAGDTAPAPDFEQRISQSFPLLLALYTRARDAYLAALRRGNRVDFNDLEGKTYELLRRPEIAARWQAEIDWVLVDEFQDTNARQREIVRALCGNTTAGSGENHKLFVVGDARQSIYRFRGADVTVFRGLQTEIQSAGGLLIDLDRTFRTHDGLLSALGDLLEPIMNGADLIQRPYHVPYSALTAHRSDPPQHVCAPHIEGILAPGRDSTQGRKAAARALAQRLLGLHYSGQIRAWSEVTLLFRASTSFPVYEDAFEEAGIPYVTVAGQGFYDRPEIRDVLNLLRVLADPWDDLALAGMLCSPVFGMRQVGLARLRWQGDQKAALYQVLQGDLSGLEEADRAVAGRAKAFLEELLPWVDRIPVAELLQRVVTWTNYRAVLASGSHRLWRNLDKLLADAQASGVVQVQAFLEYLSTLKDVGAREGEAAAEAEGAVRLMTIHKSKGLEFEFVVLADAARGTPNLPASFFLLPGLGLAYKPDRIDNEPLAYRYAKLLDKCQAESEDCRLLYVALTRAKDKVLISGHYTVKEAKVSVTGWLKELLNAAGFDLDALSSADKAHTEVTLPCGQKMTIWTHIPEAAVPAPASQPAGLLQPVADSLRPLYRSTIQPAEALVEDEELATPIWRATGQDNQVIGQTIGKMVHKAIQRWRFPEDPGLDNLLDSIAREAGVVEESRRLYALQEAEQFLSRFRAHPFWQAIDQAAVRLHEAPYTLLRADGRTEVGYIDLLYREAQSSAGWTVVDFKTDTILSDGELALLVEQYTRQARRYTQAVRSLLGSVDAVKLCFLDACGHVVVVEV
jgi:ATP-dependent helicase/nuclease subunit A